MNEKEAQVFRVAAIMIRDNKPGDPAAFLDEIADRIKQHGMGRGDSGV